MAVRARLRDVLADQLSEDRPPGLIFVDRAQDVFFRPRLRVHAEKLGEEVVRRAVARDHPHERQVGDVLHRSQGGQRLARNQ